MCCHCERESCHLEASPASVCTHQVLVLHVSMCTQQALVMHVTRSAWNRKREYRHLVHYITL